MACLFAQEKELLVATEKKDLWAPELVCMLWRRKNIFLLPEVRF
jgi:hypothetical protein